MSKILVRIPQWLGDAVVSTVFLNRLRRLNPDASIVTVCARPLASIFESHPAVQSVLTFSYSDGDTVFSVAQKIKMEHAGQAYILPRSFRTALEMWLARVPRRIGFGGDMRRWLLTEARPYRSDLLYAHRYLNLLGEERIPLEGEKLHFPKQEISDEDARRLFGKPMSDVSQPILGMAPASVAPARTWLEDRFVDVGKRFIERFGGTVLLFGSPRERELTASVRSKIGPSAIDTAGKLSLPQLGNVLSRCRLLVANDSGLMHAASAFQVPSVVIFGPSDPTFALPPWGMTSALQNKDISCVPCLRNECARFGNHYKECMTSIGVEKVMKEVEKMMEKN